VPEADAEDHPAVGQVLHGGDLLGQQRGVQPPRRSTWVVRRTRSVTTAAAASEMSAS
jgi:hypothetical protein